MKKLILIAICAVFAFSQDLTQGLGFAAGGASGGGFSYRFLGEEYGFQVTAGIISFAGDEDEYYYDNDYDGLSCDYIDESEEFSKTVSYRNTFGNIGLLAIKPLLHFHSSDFFVFAGGMAWFRHDNDDVVNYHYYCQDSTVHTEEIGVPYTEKNT